MASHLLRAALAPALVSMLACGQPTAPAPVPVDPNAPVIGAHTGPVAIEFVGANVAPGSTIAGCGATLDGCAGRLRLTFRLRAGATGGPVLKTVAWLHGVNKIACFSAAGPPFALAANATPLVDFVFDQTNAACVLPFESTDLAVNVEGGDGAAGRQELGIRYRFIQ